MCQIKNNSQIQMRMSETYSSSNFDMNSKTSCSQKSLYVDGGWLWLDFDTAW